VIVGAEEAPLGAHAQVIAGQSPDGRFYNQDGNGLPFYQGKKDFGDWELQPPTKWTTQVTKEALPGDILMSVRAPVGPVNFTREKVCIGRGLAAIRCRNGVDADYLFYQLLGMQDRIAGKEGAVFASINKAEIEALPIVAPPLPEQRRIVAILDEAFEAIATATAATEKNQQNAQALFAGHIQAVFSQQGDGWITKTVSDWVSDGVLAKPQDGNHGEIHPTSADYVDEGVPFIMAADLIDGRVDTQRCRFISRAQAEALRIGFAKTGDVLLSHKGTIGRVAILDTNYDYVMLTPQVTYYRSLNTDRLFNGFLYYCLLSPEFQAAMNRIAGAGSTRAYIGITRQLDLQISLPPIEIQRSTAAQLRRIQDDSSALAAIYEAKLAALVELKKSLLHHAFTGVLTAKTADQQLEAVA
jgi:type I restriction enzyme, S subunit